MAETMTAPRDPIRSPTVTWPRALGYCESIGLYQKPAPRFRKAYEDRAFRWLLGTEGTALDIPSCCQIRHAVKGGTGGAPPPAGCVPSYGGAGTGDRDARGQWRPSTSLRYAQDANANVGE